MRQTAADMQGFPANYWRILGASAASNLADGVFFIVLPLLAAVSLLASTLPKHGRTSASRGRRVARPRTRPRSIDGS